MPERYNRGVTQTNILYPLPMNPTLYDSLRARPLARGAMSGWHPSVAHPPLSPYQQGGGDVSGFHPHSAGYEPEARALGQMALAIVVQEGMMFIGEHDQNQSTPNTSLDHRAHLTQHLSRSFTAFRLLSHTVRSLTYGLPGTSSFISREDTQRVYLESSLLVFSV